MMEIRILNSFDAESYWALRLEALQQNPEAFTTSYEEAVKRENPVEQTARNLSTEENYTFGAFENEELIGVVTLLLEKAIQLRHRANIFAMYVTPKKQGLGVGEAILTEAINKAQTLEVIEKVNLSVVSSNEKARKLYTKLGFKVYGYEENALKINGVRYDDEHRVLHLK
jgi:ribosomal protein S18 acetylase RimI-like enzyme